jgi:hypothetical protein
MDLQVAKTKIFQKFASNLGVKVKDLTAGGEKLRTEIGLKYHKISRVHRDNNTSNPFPMNPVSKITGVFRNQAIFQDLPRRDNKRNFTLTEKGKVFLFIQSIPVPGVVVIKDEEGKVMEHDKAVEKWKKSQAEEKQWLSDKLNLIDYSSIAQAEISSEVVSNYVYVEKEEVNVPVRELSYLSAIKLTWLRSEKKMEGDTNYLYYVVDKMSDIEGCTTLGWSQNKSIDSRMEILAEVMGYTPIVIAKSKMRYFENGDHLEFTDKLWDEKVTTKKRVVKKLTDLVEEKSLKDLHSSYDFGKGLKHFDFLVPSRFKVEESDDQSTLSLSNSAKSDLRGLLGLQVTDWKAEWSEYWSELRTNYPLLKLVSLNSYSKPDQDQIDALKVALENAGWEEEKI